MSCVHVTPAMSTQFRKHALYSASLRPEKPNDNGVFAFSKVDAFRCSVPAHINLSSAPGTAQAGALITTRRILQRFDGPASGASR